MKEKRRDSKGRILHTGESQRTDGKYLYKIVYVKTVGWVRMHEKLANLSNFCFTLVVHLVSGRQARHIVSHGMQHVIWKYI